MEIRIGEEMVVQEHKEMERLLKEQHKERERRLKEEHEEKERILKEQQNEAMAVVVSKNREREERMKRESESAFEQLRKQREESLALLLSENEVKMEALLVEVAAKQKTNVTRKRKSEQLETREANVGQNNKSRKIHPSAPECPVCAFNYTFSVFFV